VRHPIAPSPLAVTYTLALKMSHDLTPPRFDILQFSS